MPYAVCGLVDLMRLSKKLNTGLFATLLAIILLSQLSMTVSASNLQSDALSALQTTTEIFEVISNPDLQTGVELYNHGNSDEFSTSHDSTDGSVNLTWAHVAGTELQLTADETPFRSEQDQLPYYWDFCYFTVSFNWLLDRIPTDAMFYVTYEVQTTGNFSSTDGDLMFNVHSWLIDSSDEWAPLLESEPPYSTSAHLYSLDLNYIDLITGWGGMVADSSGIQEDPEDILQVGVGLAPSENFDSYDGTFPWEEYDGSVTTLVHTLSLIVTLEPEETASMIIDLYYIVAPVGIIAAVAIVYLIWRRYKSTSG